MREWRNWQTRTFEGRVVHTVRVQVPFLAPNKSNGINDAVAFVLCNKPTQNPFERNVVMGVKLVFTCKLKVPFLYHKNIFNFFNYFSFLIDTHFSI